MSPKMCKEEKKTRGITLSQGLYDGQVKSGKRRLWSVVKTVCKLKHEVTVRTRHVILIQLHALYTKLTLRQIDHIISNIQ